MNTAYRPQFGTSSDFKEAFPDIEEVHLMSIQDPDGHYCFHDWQRKYLYTKSTLPSFLRCMNAKCQDGGIAVQRLITEYGNGEHDLPCGGREGKAAGKNEGDLCNNRFNVTLLIQRSPKESL